MWAISLAEPKRLLLDALSMAVEGIEASYLTFNHCKDRNLRCGEEGYIYIYIYTFICI